MSATDTITAIERLLSRKQTVPSKLISDLLKDTKALLSLTVWQRTQIEKLQKAAQAEKEGAS